MMDRYIRSESVWTMLEPISRPHRWLTRKVVEGQIAQIREKACQDCRKQGFGTSWGVVWERVGRVSDPSQ